MTTLTKRMNTLLRRDRESTQSSQASSSQSSQAPQSNILANGQTDVSVSKIIRQFCTSGQKEDDLFALLTIPQVALASPASAQEALKTVRKILANPTTDKQHELYNAAMLIGILARHEEGEVFVKVMDDRLVGTVRAVLRTPKVEANIVKLLIKETLDEFDTTIKRAANDPRALDNTRILATRWQNSPAVQKLLDLRKDPQNWYWLKIQSDAMGRAGHHPGVMGPPGTGPSGMMAASKPPFPDAKQLAERISEGESSAQILTQIVITTPQGQLVNNALITEFTHRCKAARDSMQAYIDWADPPPDADTLTNLVATQQRISTALNKRNVAMAQARAVVGAAPSPNPSPVPPVTSFSRPPPSASVANGTTAPAASLLPSVSSRQQQTSSPYTEARLENPFDDSNDIYGVPESPPTHDESRTNGMHSAERPALAINTSYTKKQQSPIERVPSPVSTADEPPSPEHTNQYRFV